MSRAAPKAPGAAAAKQPFKLPSALSRLKLLKEAAKADGLLKDARSVLLHLAIYMDVEGLAFPSATLLADDCGYGERQVRSALRALREAGIVVQLHPTAWKLAFPGRAKVPKHLPMQLLWPAATPSVRAIALGALSSKPEPPRDFTPAEPLWFVTVPDAPVKEPQGPYPTANIERWARTEPGAGAWTLRGAAEGATPNALENFYYFGAFMPRAPKWARARGGV